MSFKLTENEIIEKLRMQNNFIKNSQMEVIKLFEYKRNGDTTRFVYESNECTNSKYWLG